MLELAGVDYDYRARPIDGFSLSPLLRQRGSLAQRSLYWHYPHYSNQLGRPGGAVRQGDWKLVEFYDDNSVELYSLKEDPGERNDLAPKVPARAAAMKKLLADWRKSVGAAMVTPNSNYDPARASQRVHPGR